MKMLLFVSLAFIFFLILDFLWFSLMGNFFKSELGGLLRLKPDGSWNIRLWAGVLTYAVLALGVAVFVLPHADSLASTALYGALFGLVTYGIYDLTNMATLSGWTLRFLIVDICWGTAATLAVSVGVKWIGKFLG